MKNLTKFNLLSLSIMLIISTFLIFNIFCPITHNLYLFVFLFCIYLERYFWLLISLQYKDDYRKYLMSKVLDPDKIYWNSKLPMIGCCSQIYLFEIHTRHKYYEFPEFENFVINHRKLFINFIQLRETGLLLLNGIALGEFLIYFSISFDLELSWRNISFNREKEDPNISVYNRPVFNWMNFVFDWKNVRLLKNKNEKIN